MDLRSHWIGLIHPYDIESEIERSVYHAKRLHGLASEDALLVAVGRGKEVQEPRHEDLIVPTEHIHTNGKEREFILYYPTFETYFL